MINNNTSFTCYLIKRNLKLGHIITKAPNKIPSGIENVPITLEATHGANLSLTYECNEGRTITISSSQSACTISGAKVHGIIVSSQNMDAEVRIRHADYWHNIPGFIYWTLCDKNFI